MTSTSAAAAASIDRVITEIVQVCVVTRDLEATMNNYIDIAGIGPWAVYDDFGPPEVTDIVFRGKPGTFRNRIAMSWTGDRMWEIIQPLEGPSPFTEFLAAHGEVMFQTLVQHAGEFDAVVERFRARGCPPLLTFSFRGNRFAYLDTLDALKMTMVVVERPANRPTPPKRPASPPQRWYPDEPGPGHVW